MDKSIVNRCAWCTSDPLYIKYHDEEWGIPLYDEQKLFELLILEGMQAGLSWLTILKKRENFRRAFDNFDSHKVSRYTEKKIASLLNDSGIIRNRLKILAVINNAKSYLALSQHQTFVDYVWQFAPIKKNTLNRKKSWVSPTRTVESDAMAKELSRQGFKFVGSTICYAFMQASGMVNDHETQCFRYINAVKNEYPNFHT